MTGRKGARVPRTAGNSWTELNQDALRGNIAQVRKALAGRSEIIFVVKSNGYGHGMLDVAKCASECGVQWFAVSHMDEALELRRAVPKDNILVLGVINPEDVNAAINARIVPIIVSETHASALSREARARKKTLRCHAKIDTGMGRLGFPWGEAADALQRALDSGGLAIDGMCTHFASASGTPDNFAETQWKRFSETVAACERMGIPAPFRHVSNSAAFSAHPEWDMDGVRVGILLYGYASKKDSIRLRTKPLLQWKTRVLQVKKVPAGFRVGYFSTYITKSETHIAVINVGYADGYSRLLSNNGFVLIRGRRVPVAGRVSMNLACVDAGPDAKIKEGDEVVLIGEQGKEAIWADEIAKWCKTIPYEILTGIKTDDRRPATAPGGRRRRASRVSSRP